MNASMPVPCPLWAEKLATTHPADLSPAERAALNAHVSTCPACAAVLADYHAMDRRILSLPPVAPLTSFSPELAGILTGQNSLARATNMPGSISRPQAQPRRRSLAPMLSTLVAVLVVAALVTGYLTLFANHPSRVANQPPLAASPTAPVQPVLTTCPAQGTARSAVMPPLTLGSHANLVYINNEVQGTSATPTFCVLQRYDAVTGHAAEIARLAHVTITGAQLSADGQWIIFYRAEGDVDSGPYKIQLIRVDGKYLQTLYCFDGAYGNFQWSPDKHILVFASANPFTLYRLDLANGKVQTLLTNTSVTFYSPRSWLDNTRIYLSDDAGTLYLLDIDKGPNQSQHDLQLVHRPWSGSFARSVDGAQLFLSHNTGGPQAPHGPSSITAEPATGGSSQPVYSNPTYGITTLRAYSPTGLLFMVDTVVLNGGDTGQNGLWKINADGTALVHLVTVNDSTPFALNLFSQDAWSDVSRDGRLYALKVETADGKDTLTVGSMDASSKPITIDIRPTQSGWTYSGAVGWTTF
jgi:eukaryotic-like serine/threonine-protein kinase